jgi:hypothetical protein
MRFRRARQAEACRPSAILISSTIGFLRSTSAAAELAGPCDGRCRVPATLTGWVRSGIRARY